MDTQEFRTLGHELVDLLAGYYDTIEEQPLFPRVEPAELEALFDEPVPERGEPAQALLDELRRKLLPYCANVSHPGYFGLITPTPLPVGVLGDFLAAGLNQNIGAYTLGPSATAMERRTVRWLCELAGYGPGAGGNLTSGGTMAHFIGMKVARDAMSGDRAQHEGVQERCAVYVSEERHVSVDKAVDAVGLGREALRVLPTDDAYRLRLDALERAIAEDRRSGRTPMCIVAIAGTTNTGAVDPLHELRRITDRERLWLHVDAAYGGGVLLSDRHRGLLDGLASADSLIIDPHKWFYAPVDAGAVLVRDERRLTASFGLKPAYLTDEMDSAGERYQYYVHGFEQSRRFRALKVWMSLKRYGRAGIGAWVDANIDHARRLHDRAVTREHFSAATVPPMSAICLRYAPPGLDEHELGLLHREVARRIEEQGRFWISTTMLKGRWYFRINPVNFRTRTEHMDELLETLEAHCAERAAGPAPAR